MGDSKRSGSTKDDTTGDHTAHTKKKNRRRKERATMKVFGAMILILLSAASCSAMAPPQHDRRKLQQLTENPFALDFEEAAEEFFKLLGPLGGTSIQRWYDGPLARTSFLNGRR